MTEFIATSSDQTGPGFQPHGAFINLKADRSNGSWATTTTTNGWLIIKCPSPVKILRVALKARPMTGKNITSWSISASSDGTTFNTLFRSTSALLGAATTPTFIEIDTSVAYQYYRLNILESVGTPGVGIQYMQLFTVDNLSS